MANGVLLASPFFYAFIVLSQYTYGYLLNGNPSFTQFWQLLFSPWRYGLLFQGPNGELSFLIGYTQIFVLLACSIFLFSGKMKKSLRLPVLFWLIVVAVTSYLITPQSSQLWKVIPILSVAQFSYRLLFFINIATSILAGFFVLHFQKHKFVIILVIFFTIFTTILNWGNRRVIPEITDATLINNLPNASYNYEALALAASPRWLDLQNLWERHAPENHLDLLRGKANLKEVKRTQTYHAYVVSSQTNILLRENTLYFPGWKVIIDGNEAVVNFKHTSSLGKMVFSVSKGLHFVEVTYQDLTFHTATKVISIIGFTSITIYLFIFYLLSFIHYEKTKRN